MASAGSSCESLENGIPYSRNNTTNPVQFRIRVLTYNRLESLQRLLRSLEEANYVGDSVALDISVDRPSVEATHNEIKQWKQVIEYLGDGQTHSSKVT